MLVYVRFKKKIIIKNEKKNSIQDDTHTTLKP
jgi:hypothetical protein